MQDSLAKQASRRGFLGTAGMTGAALAAAACAPAAAPASNPAAAPVGTKEADWEQRWGEWKTGAKQEGRVVVGFGGGTNYERIVEAFGKSFPGVTLEFSVFPTATLFLPRFWQERDAGVTSYDITFSQTAYAVPELKAKGALVPIRPHLIHPEILVDNQWIGGFDFGFVDNEKQYGYAPTVDYIRQFFINTDAVKEGEIKTFKDILDPKWKGKIAVTDVIDGAVFWSLLVIKRTLGEGVLKQFLIDQQPVFTGRDARVITEGMVRGKYAIAMGPRTAILADFLKEGLGANVKAIDLPEAKFAAFTNQMWMIDKAPHPNAAKLFLNWILTREAQALFADSTKRNSRRIGVAPSDASQYVSIEAIKGFQHFLGTESSVVEEQQMPAYLQKMVRGS